MWRKQNEKKLILALTTGIFLLFMEPVPQKTIPMLMYLKMTGLTLLWPILSMII